jgi:hypothetical protein
LKHPYSVNLGSITGHLQLKPLLRSDLGCAGAASAAKKKKHYFQENTHGVGENRTSAVIKTGQKKSSYQRADNCSFVQAVKSVSDTAYSLEQWRSKTGT